MVNEELIEQNEYFYAPYKLVFKFCQIALLSHQKEKYTRRVTGIAQKIADAQTLIDTQEAIKKNLDFHEELRQEAQRMKDQEIATLQIKHDNLKAQMSKIQKEDADFIADYFKEIMN